MPLPRDPYVSWAQCAWGWFFTGNDPHIPPEDLVNIKPLAAWYSRQLWHALVSKNHRHVVLLSPDEWLAPS